MIKKTHWRAMAAIAIAIPILSSCSDNENPDSGNGAGEGKFVLATSVTGSQGTSYVLLTAETLDEGTVSTVRNGLNNDGATQWVFHQDYLYGLTYNQGNAGTTRSYYLGEDGQMKARGVEYSISRFSSYGTYNDNIITMSTGSGQQEYADKDNNLPQTLLISYLNVKDQTMISNDTHSRAYIMEDFLSTGEYVTLSGAEQVGSKLYCGAIPMGLSPYGSAFDNGRFIRDGFEDLVKKSDGGSGSGSYKKGELQGTQYPDECWVAIYSDETMTAPTLAYTNKISTPCGRFRSQYYQTIWADSKGDIYVFSPSYSKTMTDPRQQTTLPAGVARIKAGSDKFDDSYYFNIEEQTGGKSFMRCWPAGGSYFLMVMYDRPLSETGFVATELAIFDAIGQKLTYVTGLPNDISSIGKTVYTANGYVYIPINTESDYPAIYKINPANGQAVKGLVVEASEVTGMGFISPVK